MSESKLIHATCVSHKGKGILLLGEPGSGKSDLALRLIDRGWALVADDQVQIQKNNNQLLASPPSALRGLMEARGLGIVTLPYEKEVPLARAIRLVARAGIERVPPRSFFECLGIQLPQVSLHAFDNSVEAKIRMALG